MFGYARGKRWLRIGLLGLYKTGTVLYETGINAIKIRGRHDGICQTRDECGVTALSEQVGLYRDFLMF